MRHQALAFVVGVLLIGACVSDDRSITEPDSPYLIRPPSPVPVIQREMAVAITEVDPDSIPRPNTLPLLKTPRVVSTNVNVQQASDPPVAAIPIAVPICEPGRNGVARPRTVTVTGDVRAAVQTQPTPAPVLGLTPTATGVFQFLDASSILNGGRVYAILQDRNGNIWFGQNGGISKYDGSSIVNYGMGNGLRAPYVLSLHEDAEGNIWIGGESGISKFDGQNFINYRVEEGVGAGAVLSIAEDHSGGIWMGTHDGAKRLSELRAGRAVITRYTTAEGLSDNIVNTVRCDRQGNLWLGTLNGGVNQFDPEANDGDGRFLHYTTEEGMLSNNVRAILEDRTGKIWFGTGDSGTLFNRNYRGAGKQVGGVTRLDPQANDGRGSFTHYTQAEGLGGNFVTSIHEDKRGNLWFGTANSGVSRLNTSGTKVIFTHFTVREGLLNNTVSCIVEDRMGNLWFGSDKNGAVRYRPGISYFAERNGLEIDETYHITGDREGNIWIGTMGNGVVRLDGKTFTYYTVQEGLAGNSVYSIVEDHDGNMWFGTDKGLSRFDPESEPGKPAFTNYTLPKELPQSPALSLTVDRKGALWVGGLGVGIIRFVPPSPRGEARLTRYDLTYDSDSLFSGLDLDRVWITKILEDSLGKIWFNMRYVGLFSLDLLEPEEKLVYHQGHPVEDVEDYRLYDMMVDRSDKLWLATKQGLQYYDGRTVTAVPIGTKLGPPLSIVPGAGGDLWLGRHQGLSHLEAIGSDPEKSGLVSTNGPTVEPRFLAIPYDKDDGLLHLNFWRGAYADRENRIWFGTGKIVTMLDLDNFPSTDHSPEITLNSIDVKQRFIDYGRLSDDTYASSLPFGNKLARAAREVEPFENYPRSLTLPSSLNHLTFRFSAIDWSALHKIQYIYLMEGLDQDWSI